MTTTPANKRLNILQITTDIGPTSFGPGQVALNLTRDQGKLGASVQLWCTSSADGVRWAAASSGLDQSRITAFPVFGPARLGYSPQMLRAAKGMQGRQISVIHQHGIWTSCSYVTSVLRWRYGLPSIIAPHGSLEAWALRRSMCKKALALAVYERKNLYQAECLHVAAEAEIAGLRAFGLAQPVAVIPNGISEAWLNSQGDGSTLRRLLGISSDRRILLYLSRITPVKGLPMLLQAINKIRKEFTDWILVIAGQDEFDHKAEVQALVRQLDLQNMVTISSALFDQAKRDAFAAAEIFVLPTRREGQGLVVIESLAAGVPVITTRGAPWQDLVTHGCGWWTNISEDGLCEAICDAISRSPEDLSAMGKRGRELARAQYSWAGLAQKTLDLYEWLRNPQSRPDFVVVD